jgi:hypothetical protein
MASSFWTTWVEIAIRHERLSLDARHDAEAAEAGSESMSEAFSREFKAALVAVTAAAFALDAFYNVVRVQGQVPEPRRDKKYRRLLAILAEGFALTDKQLETWRPQVRDLYHLRNAAVHHESKFRPSYEHPTKKSHVGYEHTQYTCEAASKGVDLALELLSTCIASGDPTWPELDAWASRASHVPVSLVEGRKRELECEGG